MRLMPVLTDGTNRTTRTPLQLGPHAIPASTMVWVPFGATFGSARSWERPDEYLPARAPRSRSPACLRVTDSERCCRVRAGALGQRGRRVRAAPTGPAAGRLRRWRQLTARPRQALFPVQLGPARLRRAEPRAHELPRHRRHAALGVPLPPGRRGARRAGCPAALAARPRPNRAPRRRWAAWRACASARPLAFSRCSLPTACSCTARRADRPCRPACGPAIAGNKDVVCERPGSGPCNMGHPRGQ